MDSGEIRAHFREQERRWKPGRHGCGPARGGKLPGKLLIAHHISECLRKLKAADTTSEVSTALFHLCLVVPCMTTKNYLEDFRAKILEIWKLAASKLSPHMLKMLYVLIMMPACFDLPDHIREARASKIRF